MAGMGNWTQEELDAGTLPARVDTNDERLTQVQADKKKASNKVRDTYDGMINQTDKFYQDQIDAVNQYAETQKKNQQEQTDFAIEQIEQQKDQAHKDYIKEQSGAYVDWQKQSGEYGVNAEQMAVQGMGGTGYSESSQVSMYNTYQNRVATARESYNRAVLNYDNAIKDARLQNNAALAEIAFNALQKQLELSLEGFQYKNSLITAKTDKEMEVDNQYWGRYTDVLDQINTENALAEEQRQFNQNYTLQVKEYEEGIRQFNAEIARLKAKDAQEYKLEIQQLEVQKDQLEEEKRQFDATHRASDIKAGANRTSNQYVTKKPSKNSRASDVKAGANKTSKSYVSNKSNSSNSGSATIDMNSVLALGYGPISASRLSELENKGLIQSYKSGNKIKFKKSAYAIKQSMLFK